MGLGTWGRGKKRTEVEKEPISVSWENRFHLLTNDVTLISGGAFLAGNSLTNSRGGCYRPSTNQPPLTSKKLSRVYLLVIRKQKLRLIYQTFVQPKLFLLKSNRKTEALAKLSKHFNTQFETCPSSEMFNRLTTSHRKTLPVKHDC